MYLGKAETIVISGFDKQNVIDGAKKYCDNNEGWMLCSDVYETRKRLGWFKWKTEYKIDLYKPIDFEIIKK